MNQTIKLLHNRRSLRVYSKKEISKNEIDIIIESAMRAPTAGNMMRYSILEVTDHENKKRLAKTCDNQPFIAKAPLVLVFLADVQRWYDFFHESKLPELCTRNGSQFVGPEEADLMLASCDALIAAQNAAIAAESLGIGSCYIGDIMENIEIHREMFNLPDLVFPIAMLCMGYYRENDNISERSTRFPKDFIHFKDKYVHFDREDFDEMVKTMIGRRFKNHESIKNADDLAHFYYKNKIASRFSEEMRRSVKVMINDWKNSIRPK